MAKTKFNLVGFEWNWGRHSSSSGKNKLKEPPLDTDNSTVDEVPSSRKRKSANAFGYGLELEGSSESDRRTVVNRKSRMMNIKRIERGCLVQNNQHYFNNAEFEVADILLNLDTYFLERVNLEISDSNTPIDQVRVFSNSTSKKTINLGVSHIRKQRKRSVNETTFELPQNFKNVISDMELEKGGEIKVKLIQPSLEITELTLVKWSIGSVSTSYILRSNWMNVAEANKLKNDDVIQVWSFLVQEKLCMAIVKL
ncbi:hypothetical protein PIB30_037977 [Stylosanthes scabra]|uniref:B3 domain-containing protein n=1 Tax=Stylosanthes scabra TaxID=79078 RepID=A0ABU6YCU4_9FABA|nr:hypothetical protein [Stylosanthes scabra]